MPRLSPSELHAAKKRKAVEEAAAERQLLEKEAAAAQQIAEHGEQLAAARTRVDLLEGMASALYDELDKLTKKAPSAPVSQLTLDKTNKLIRAVRELTKPHADEFTEDIRELIAAGDLPEYRDVLLTLREAKEALRRFEAALRKDEATHRYRTGQDDAHDRIQSILQR